MHVAVFFSALGLLHIFVCASWALALSRCRRVVTAFLCFPNLLSLGKATADMCQGERLPVTFLLSSRGIMVHYLRVLPALRCITACSQADYVFDLMLMRSLAAGCMVFVYYQFADHHVPFRLMMSGTLSAKVPLSGVPRFSSHCCALDLAEEWLCRPCRSPRYFTKTMFH